MFEYPMPDPGPGPHGHITHKNRKKHTNFPGIQRSIPPVFTYLSTCCNAPATKPAASSRVDVENPETHKVKTQAIGLGKWTCTTCHKHNVKVKRTKVTS